MKKIGGYVLAILKVSGSRSLVGLDAKNKVASDSKTLKS